MAYDTTQTYDSTPNSGVPFDISTSYLPGLLDETTGEAGYGSLLNRSVANDLLYYYATKYPFDQMYQLFGGFDTTSTGKYEWGEADVYLEDSAEGLTENAADVINNTDGGTNYVPDTTARFAIAEADAEIFSVYGQVRYENNNGEWSYGWITDIANSANGASLTLQSIDGENLVGSMDNDTVIQFLAPNVPQDRNLPIQPKSSNPEMNITYTQNYERTIGLTEKFRAINQAGGTIVDLLDHHTKQLAENFRKDREVDTLLGAGALAIHTIPNGDKAQFSSGLYNIIRGDNLHTADLTSSGVFDASKFKNFVQEFVLRNFAGESGGPFQRDFYVDPLLKSYFDRAWEDNRRFMTNELVAGVTVNRFQQSGYEMDIMTVPSWADLHPIPNAQLRGGSDKKGAGLLVPMDSDHVVRVVQEGRGPRQEVFRVGGGDREWFTRMESNETVVPKLRQHFAVFEQVDE